MADVFRTYNSDKHITEMKAIYVSLIPSGLLPITMSRRSPRYIYDLPSGYSIIGINLMGSPDPLIIRLREYYCRISSEKSELK